MCDTQSRVVNLTCFSLISSLFLICSNEGTQYLKLVTGDSVKNLKILQSSNIDKQLLESANDQEPYRSEDISKKKESLLQFFAESHIPFTSERENLLVLNEVLISPPYTSGNCMCVNEVMLKRVQKLVKDFGKLYKLGNTANK